MYSKEDRERILADLDASGLPAAVFAKLPGNPSRNSLSGWRRQAEAGELDVPVRDVRGRCERSRHERYPEAAKREALALRRKGMRWCDIARRLNVSSGTVVRSWAKAAERATMAPKEAVSMEDRKPKDMARAELEERLAEAQMQARVLQELMRDPKAADPERLSNKQKTALGERLRRDYGYSLGTILSFLDISKSTYEYDKGAIARDAARAEAVRVRVRGAFERSRRIYGYRRVRASILSGADGEEPMAVSELEVRRAMKAGGMRARRTRERLHYSSYAGEPDERPGNAPLGEGGVHDFSAEHPDEMVVSDVAEFKAGGAQGVPLSDRRLLRRHARRMVGVAASRLGPVRLVASGLPGHAAGGPRPRRRAHRRGLPVPGGLLEAHLRRGRRRALDVEEGALPGQRAGRGLLRDPQGGVLQRARLVRGPSRALHGRARRVHGMVPERKAQGFP